MPTGTHLRFTIYYEAGVYEIGGGTPWSAFTNYFDYLADDPVDYAAAAAVLWDHFIDKLKPFCLWYISMKECTVHNPETALGGIDTVLYAPGREYGQLIGEGPSERMSIDQAVIVQRTWNRSIQRGRGRVFLPPTHREFISDELTGEVDDEHPTVSELVDAIGATVIVGSVELHPSLWSPTFLTMTQCTQVFASKYLGRRVVRRPY